MSMVYGMGINDFPKGAINKSGLRSCHQRWMSMLRRCYSQNALMKNPSYIGCMVSDDFLKFSSFRDWFFDQRWSQKPGYDLDKDILKKGNRVYSPEYCVFVPGEINKLVLCKTGIKNGLLPGVSVDTGKEVYRARAVDLNGRIITLGRFNNQVDAFFAYKEAKEKRIKAVALKHRSMIDERVFDALMNYRIELSDWPQ